MLVNGAKILSKAHKEGYAVGAFNAVNLEMMSSYFEAANECESPLIIQASEGAIKYADVDVFMAIARALSLKYPHIPVAIHLDHGTSFESCMRAIRAGFTSVMIDASHHSFEENLEITKKVVEVAHTVDVGVEAELGRLMGIEDNIQVDERDASLVNVDEAEKFVKETKVDYLAPAIGTSHGAFKFKGEPRLDFERLQEVKRRCDVPLVLHGASAIPEYVRVAFESTGGDLKGSKGVPFDFLVEAVKGGINKVNTDTDVRIAFMAEVRRVANENKSEFDLRNFFKPAKNAVKNLVVERMKLLGSCGKI